MRIAAAMAIGFLQASLCTAVLAADRLTDAPFATRSEVIALHAMAATSQPLATQIALDVMKQGATARSASATRRPARAWRRRRSQP